MHTREERFYSRLHMDIPCTVYSGASEVSGRVMNICEEGIAVGLTYDDHKRLDPARNIRLLIQFIDEVDLFEGKSLEDILLSVEVVHEEDIGSGYVIGCHVDESNNSSMEYSKYVDLKKTNAFIISNTTTAFF
ncbi:MAG: PilZ domain-containing protein [Lachnospiraceae bacterium]|nr:PilZ domain-containing protein [Lachnospiraceae bacterium]